jgi:cyanophycinase-like exopeptidase
LPILRREDAFNPEYVSAITNAGLIYFSGGDPGYITEVFAGTPLWEKIKEGEYNGFSLEGYFIEKYEDDMVDSMLLEIQSTLKDYTDETLIEKKIKRILGME